MELKRGGIDDVLAVDPHPNTVVEPSVSPSTLLKGALSYVQMGDLIEDSYQEVLLIRQSMLTLIVKSNAYSAMTSAVASTRRQSHRTYDMQSCCCDQPYPFSSNIQVIFMLRETASVDTVFTPSILRFARNVEHAVLSVPDYEKVAAPSCNFRIPYW